MRLILAKFGLEGIGAIIQLQQMIFREGYCCSWNEETEQLFIIENHTTKERINEILEYCLEHEFFDQTILERYGVLTSKAIQIQWIKVCEACRRKNCRVVDELSLVNAEDLDNDETEGKLGNPPSKSVNIRENPELLRQRRESKERDKKKEEYTKSEKSEPPRSDYIRVGDSTMMEQILRNLETKKEKGPD